MQNKNIKYLYTLKFVKWFSYILAKWLQVKMHEGLIGEIEKHTKLINKLENIIKFLDGLTKKQKSKIELLNEDYQSRKYLKHNYKYFYYYGFKILWGALIKGSLLLIVGLVLGILPQMLVVVLAFMSLRVFVGGLHFNSYTKCAWISLATLTLFSLLSALIPYNYIINLSIFLTVFVIAMVYAPVEHKNRLLTDNEKVKFKGISLVIIFILYILQLSINSNWVSNSIMYGVLLSGIIALPIFKKVE